MFDEFWSKYPRKIARKYAKQCFDRLSPDNKKAAISGLDQYLKYWQVKGTQSDFIMHASTFINQERWTDELDLDNAIKMPWFSSDQATIEKGREIGCHSKPGEGMSEYRERIKNALLRSA